MLSCGELCFDAVAGFQVRWRERKVRKGGMRGEGTRIGNAGSAHGSSAWAHTRRHRAAPSPRKAQGSETFLTTTIVADVPMEATACPPTMTG